MLTKKNIKLPPSEDFSSLSPGFLEKGDLQDTILTIKGTHIEIRAPKKDPGVFFNRKQFYSLDFICAVDIIHAFKFITFGFGSSHDAIIFKNSSICDFAASLVGSGYHIVWDKAFVGLPGVITPNYHIVDNIKLEKQRVTIENTFGLLKGKFKKFTSAIINGEEKRCFKLF